MSIEVEVPTIDTLLLPMELLYTGQFTMGDWKLHNYSLKMEQVYQIVMYNVHQVASKHLKLKPSFATTVIWSLYSLLQYSMNLFK